MLFSHLVEYTVLHSISLRAERAVERPRHQHTKIEGTVPYVGIEVDDALEIAEHSKSEPSARLEP